MTMTSNPYLAGNFGPVSEEITAFDLEVTGTIPDGLDGRLIRNGPNPRGEVDPAQHHWFVGDGMVHGLRLRDGRAEWYRNRFVGGDGMGQDEGGGAQHQRHRPCRPHVGHRGVRHPPRRADR